LSKIVVVTGASAGVGRATALEFARNGCDVALIARDQERLDRAAQEVRQCGVRALPISADVSDFAAIDAILRKNIRNSVGPEFMAPPARETAEPATLSAG